MGWPLCVQRLNILWASPRGDLQVGGWVGTVTGNNAMFTSAATPQPGFTSQACMPYV
jgi:hypothetical protein